MDKRGYIFTDKNSIGVMTKKLPISPDTSYMLGIYRCNNSHVNIFLETSSRELVERFIKIAVMELDTHQDAITITDDGEITSVEIKNSKLKKLLDAALDRRDQIFKYKNEYSASFFGAMFDCKGSVDKRGIFIRGVNAYEKIMLERIGFHTTTNGGRCYIRGNNEFLKFIVPFSIRAQVITKQINEAKPR